MEVLILTGLSGAGKTQVVHFLEDMGYFCIENLPPYLILPFLQSVNEESLEEAHPLTEKISTHLHLGVGKKPLGSSQIALIIDARIRSFFPDFEALAVYLDHLRTYFSKNKKMKILYLDASTEVLLSRYKQTRRVHPLSQGRNLEEAILLERDLLQGIKESAHYILDTSEFSLAELRNSIYHLLYGQEEKGRLSFFVSSFGFKYGLPQDCDLIFDARFLPNPHYVPHLRPLTGKDQAIKDFVFLHDISHKYVQQLLEHLLLLYPYYINEGKHRLTIGIGCTGGKHRSVAITEALSEDLAQSGYVTYVEHRDIEKDTLQDLGTNRKHRFAKKRIEKKEGENLC